MDDCSLLAERCQGAPNTEFGPSHPQLISLVLLLRGYSAFQSLYRTLYSTSTQWKVVSVSLRQVDEILLHLIVHRSIIFFINIYCRQFGTCDPIWNGTPPISTLGTKIPFATTIICIPLKRTSRAQARSIRTNASNLPAFIAPRFRVMIKLRCLLSLMWLLLWSRTTEAPFDDPPLCPQRPFGFLLRVLPNLDWEPPWLVSPDELRMGLPPKINGQFYLLWGGYCHDNEAGCEIDTRSALCVCSLHTKNCIEVASSEESSRLVFISNSAG